MDQGFKNDPVGCCLLAKAAAHARAVPPERWRFESDVAAVCARYLACHPRVMWVRYPGLPNDPSYVRAAQELRCGFGPTLAYELADHSLHLLCCGAGDALELVQLLEDALGSPLKLV